MEECTKMMNFIWVGMIIFSVISALMSHKTNFLTPSALEGAQKAIEIAISLSGSLCLWSGLAKLMERSGLTHKLGKLLRPLFRKLLPRSAQDPLTLGYVTANVSANLLGLGNAATPMGISAVKRMQELRRPSEADDEMCRFIIMNTASIQLLPTTVASVRSALGSPSPFDILPAVWFCSLLSVSVGLLAARFLRRFYA